MNTLKQLILGFLVIVMAGTIVTSCGDDGPSVCSEADYVGTWVGKYKIAGLITLPNNDTLVITVSGSTVTINSQLLGGTSFNATYDESTGNVTVANLTIPSIQFGSDSFTDISVDGGTIELSSECSKLFLSLDGVSVAAGTINLPAPLTYPLGPTTITTNGTGFTKQP